MTVNTNNYGRTPLAPRQARWRCRPDGSQEWRTLALSTQARVSLRRRAATCGVTADAWLNVAMAQTAMGDIELLERRLDLTPVRRATDRRLCDWQDYLEGQDGPGVVDELPEVVFSMGAIGNEALRKADIADLLVLSDREWDLARRCEIRAAGLSLSLPAFVQATSTPVEA
jgi:hypothetical protein